MSWSFSKTVGRDDMADSLPEAAAKHFESINAAKTAETDDQVATAIDAAVTLAGSVGTDGELQVVLSGHSNPGHGKVEGYANEMIAVSISER